MREAGQRNFPTPQNLVVNVSAPPSGNRTNSGQRAIGEQRNQTRIRVSPKPPEQQLTARQQAQFLLTRCTAREDLAQRRPAHRGRADVCAVVERRNFHHRTRYTEKLGQLLQRDIR